VAAVAAPGAPRAPAGERGGDIRGAPRGPRQAPRRVLPRRGEVSDEPPAAFQLCFMFILLVNLSDSLSFRLEFWPSPSKTSCKTSRSGQLQRRQALAMTSDRFQRHIYADMQPVYHVFVPVMALINVSVIVTTGCHAAGCLPGERVCAAGAARCCANLLLLESPNR
jgi:hypothetical protein